MKSLFRLQGFRLRRNRSASLEHANARVTDHPLLGFHLPMVPSKCYPDLRLEPVSLGTPVVCRHISGTLRFTVIRPSKLTLSHERACPSRGFSPFAHLLRLGTVLDGIGD